MINPSALAAAALDYGPYLFAILFVTTLTVIAQRAYTQAVNEEQVRTFRLYFYVSFYFGLGLVLVCVLSWLFDTQVQHKYVYTVDIQNVPATVSLWSTEACIIKRPVEGVPVETVHAIFVEDARLAPGTDLALLESPPSGLGSGPGLSQLRKVFKVKSTSTQLDFHDLQDFR